LFISCECSFSPRSCDSKNRACCLCSACFPIAGGNCSVNVSWMSEGEIDAFVQHLISAQDSWFFFLHKRFCIHCSKVECGSSLDGDSAKATEFSWVLFVLAKSLPGFFSILQRRLEK
jgi:hypothetical protein